MGVFLCRRTMGKLRNQIAHYRLERHIMANKIVKLRLYFFSINDIDIFGKKINGVYWDEAEQLWSEKDFDFPKVLYIRGSAGKRNSLLYKDFIGIIKGNGGTILNYPNFNKFDVYSKLKHSDQMNKYLPPTIAYNGPSDLDNMLKKHSSLYLKAFVGRKGKNVMRVDVQPDHGYKYSYLKIKKRAEDELVEKTVKSFTRLQKEIDMFFQGKRFLIQKAIDLIEINGRKVDMRAEVQRNKDNHLEIIGVSVRLGSVRSPITTHSEAYKLTSFFEEVMQYSKDEVANIESRVKKFLVKTYNAIEQCYGPYAEIGIDFAMDKNGVIWFIECNSQSTKVSLEKAYAEHIYLKSFINPLEYACYVVNTKSS